MTKKIKGRADGSRSRAFSDRMRERNPSFEPHAYRQLTGTDLVTSKIGYGSYRVDHRFDEHTASLRRAIQAGCNLIDTSSNYTDGGSETLIGNVLSDQISAGQIKRSEIIVVSKVGYIQGQNLDEAMRREGERRSLARSCQVYGRLLALHSSRTSLRISGSAVRTGCN